MILLILCFIPIIFAFWAIGQTIVIVARIFKFDITCARVKKKDPALYRHLKNEEYRIMNGGRSGYWIIHHHKVPR